MISPPHIITPPQTPPRWNSGANQQQNATGANATFPITSGQPTSYAFAGNNQWHLPVMPSLSAPLPSMPPPHANNVPGGYYQQSTHTPPPPMVPGGGVQTVYHTIPAGVPPPNMRQITYVMPLGPPMPPHGYPPLPVPFVPPPYFTPPRAASLPAQLPSMSRQQMHSMSRQPTQNYYKPRIKHCFDWAKGKCWRGESCKFSHDQRPGQNIHNNGPWQNRPRGICFDWEKNQCRRGANCKYAHSRTPGANQSITPE